MTLNILLTLISFTRTTSDTYLHKDGSFHWSEAVPNTLFIQVMSS